MLTSNSYSAIYKLYIYIYIYIYSEYVDHEYLGYVIFSLCNGLSVCSLQFVVTNDCSGIDIGPEYMICEQYEYHMNIHIAHQGGY